MHRDKKEAEFLKTFKAAYTLASPFALQPKGTDGSGSFAALYERSKTLKTTAQALIENYEHASECVASLDMKGLMDNSWEEEDRALVKLLRGWQESRRAQVPHYPERDQAAGAALECRGGARGRSCSTTTKLRPRANGDGLLGSRRRR